MEITFGKAQLSGITMEQFQAILGILGNNIDWGYLHFNFDLQKILEIIKRNEERVGELFTDIFIDSDFKPINIRKRKRLYFTEVGLIISLEIKFLLFKNIKWSLIDFKKNELQKKIINNHLSFGQDCTNFLVSLMTNQELGLV